jgi:pyruvate dehydrogenase E2 component (dihydrolipoamide acetyltransferase)
MGAAIGETQSSDSHAAQGGLLTERHPHTTLRLNGMRGEIARRMVESLHTMAQLTLMRTVDARPLRRIRKSLTDEDSLEAVTYNDLFMLVVARALGEHPRLNATLENSNLIEWETINLGFAVALPAGLVVPVIRDCQTMALAEMARRARELASAAVAGRLHIGDVVDGTFTISNLGAYGIDQFTPIINPPQVAILGVGRVLETVALSLTIDHQALDGAAGAMFLQSVADKLENPDLLVT